MAEYEVFQNPPITEAIIDIRTILPDDISLNDLEKLHDRVKDRFPQKEEMKFFSGKMKLPDKHDSGFDFINNDSRTLGYLFKSEKGSTVVQFRLDGFTFNKLKPYQNWEIFSGQGRDLWNLYLETTKPSQIQRIGVRYINHILLPLPFDDFDEYILTNPKIAPDLPQGLFSFFMRFEIPHPEMGFNAIVTQTMEPPNEERRLPFVYDIDVFKMEDYTKNPDKIWDDLTDLKKFENDIFFKSITDKTKELFK